MTQRAGHSQDRGSYLENCFLLSSFSEGEGEARGGWEEPGGLAYLEDGPIYHAVVGAVGEEVID